MVTTPGGRRRPELFLRLLEHDVKSRDIQAYARALRRHLAGRRLILIWDRLQAHKSRSTQDFLERQRPWLTTGYFPAYAPELNPVEGLWAYVDRTDMANFCAQNPKEVRRQVHKATCRVRHRPDLSREFIKHSGLL